LIELLKEKAQQLLEQGLFLNGDSAYPMYSFLQVPCDQQEVKADPVGAKDAYNYCAITRQTAYGSNALLVS